MKANKPNKNFTKFLEDAGGMGAGCGDAPQANNTTNIGGGYPVPFMRKRRKKKRVK